MCLAIAMGSVRVQELVCAADSEVEAVLAYRNALENALGQPAAAHPVEGYGASSLSLAQVPSLTDESTKHCSCTGALAGRRARPAWLAACMPGMLMMGPVDARSHDHIRWCTNGRLHFKA